MNVEQRVFNSLFKEDKTELATQKVDLSLISDIEKILDKANSERRRLENTGKKLASDLNNLQGDYDTALLKSKQAENKAKELGASDLMKLFGNRGDEAKDYSSAVGSASNKISAIINSI
tara:strand:- start:635 stop:991 length:357 start_codon:yes stop_codon:yes gene_type:complete